VGLINADYKNIKFSRSDGIEVNVKVNLNDPSDLDEDFLVLSIENINTPIEVRLFYWINKKRWTLNEFKFFALNNNLCIQIYDKQNNELASLGVCGISARKFNNVFGNNFN
jgi:hypothetical protein